MPYGNGCSGYKSSLTGWQLDFKIQYEHMLLYRQCKSCTTSDHLPTREEWGGRKCGFLGTDGTDFSCVRKADFSDAFRLSVAKDNLILEHLWSFILKICWSLFTHTWLVSCWFYRLKSATHQKSSWYYNSRTLPEGENGPSQNTVIKCLLARMHKFNVSSSQAWSFTILPCSGAYSCRTLMRYVILDCKTG